MRNPFNFTPRERKVARLIALGLANREIGQQVHNTVLSVRQVASAVYEKVGVTSRLQLAIWYWNHFPQELELKRAAEESLQ